MVEKVYQLEAWGFDNCIERVMFSEVVWKNGNEAEKNRIPFTEYCKKKGMAVHTVIIHALELR